MLHYVDVDLRQERGKLCFVKRKDNVFLSDNRVVFEEKVWIFRVLPFWIKKVVDFLSKSPFFHFLLPCFYFGPPTFHFLHPCFHFIPPTFSTNLPVFSPYFPIFISYLPPLAKMQRTFLSCSFFLLLRYAYRCIYADMCSHIAHSPSSEFLPSPFTFTFNSLKT